MLLEILRKRTRRTRNTTQGGRLKLVILGDTHSSHHGVALPPGDILIHTGDLLGGAWNKTQFEDLRAWFTGMDFEHKIYVPGNHDGLVQKDTDWVRKALPGVTILIDEEITIGHLKFYGTPWTPPFMNWYYMKTEEELVDVFGRIPLDTDVLITHGPAWGIRDENIDGIHCGSTALLGALQDINPALHVFGHIHEGYGLTIVDQTLHANVSVLNHVYDVANEPFEIDLSDN